MNVEHTDDRRRLADSLNRFVAEQYAFEARDRIARSDAGMNAELWQRFAGGGYDLAVVVEVLGRGLVVEPFLATVLAGSAIAHAGSAAQKALLGGLIDGTRVATFAHGEPDARYELLRVATTARRDGSGWVLDGVKAVVPHGERADLLVVSARSSGQDDDPDGISLFVVPATAPGVSLRGGRDRTCGRPRRAGAVRRGAWRDGRGQRGDARLPAQPQAIRRADRQLPGASAPHGRPAARD